MIRYKKCKKCDRKLCIEYNSCPFCNSQELELIEIVEHRPFIVNFYRWIRKNHPEIIDEYKKKNPNHSPLTLAEKL